MENPKDYFSRTENTVRMLLKEHNACKAKVRTIQKLIVQGCATKELEPSEITFGEWWKKNNNDHNVILEAQKKYSIEAVQCGILAGSVLKIAARAIECYSKNAEISENWKNKFLPSEFFIGRVIYTVPLGLLIYAGWNHYRNPAGIELTAANYQIFKRVGLHSKLSEFDFFSDPDSSFIDLHFDYFASEVLDVLCWIDYDNYLDDMQTALSQ